MRWCLHPVMGGKQTENIHFCSAYLAGCYAQLLFTGLFAALVNHAQHIRPFVTHFCESDNFQIEAGRAYCSPVPAQM